MVSDGSDVNYKSMLVTKGFSQFHGEDYTDTFALVPTMESIWLVFSIAASK